MAWVKHTGAEYEHLSDKYNYVSRYFGCVVRKARSMKSMGNTDRGFVLIDKDMRIRTSGMLVCRTIPFQSTN